MSETSGLRDRLEEEILYFQERGRAWADRSGDAGSKEKLIADTLEKVVNRLRSLLDGRPV